MTVRRPPRAWLVLVGLCVSGIGCRALNPRFVAGDSGLETNSTATQASTTRGPNTGLHTIGSKDVQTSTNASQSQTTEVESSSTDPTTSETRTSNGTNSSAATTTEVPAMRWDPQGPTVAPNPGTTDYCAKGATTCFLIRASTQPRVASGTPGHEDIALMVANTLALSPLEQQRSPTGEGLGFNGVDSRLETEGDFPVYADQDFGIELLYRRDASYTFSRKMMLMQVHRDIWLQEWPNGGISCYLTDSFGTPREMQHAHKPPPGQEDMLRHVLCFLHAGKVHLLINGKYQSVGNGDGSTHTFEIPVNKTTGELTLGRWAQANPQGAVGFVPFKGVMYLARTWNNVTKMKNAVMQELPAHGFSTLEFAEFTPSVP